MKTSEIISAIKEVCETLALTNLPEPIIDSVLETISRTLNPDYCWIQLLDDETGRLSLAAFRGLDTPVPYELDSIDAGHPVYNAVIGMGDNIIIPKLSKDGHYRLDIFLREGFSSLLVVPMLTYRVHGILGLAYRKKRKLKKEYTGLLTAIASLTAMALNKSKLKGMRSDNESEKDDELKPPAELMAAEREESDSFQEHLRKMKIFHSSHD